MAGKSYPIVTPSVELEVKKKLRPGVYRMHLLTDRGATVTVEPGVEKTETIDVIMPGGTAGKIPVTLIEGNSVMEIKSAPELTNRIISSNIFANAIGLSANRRTIIISLLVGLLLGAILATWIFILFLR
jgi:hypothetical protein